MILLVRLDQYGLYCPAVAGVDNDGDRTDWEASTFRDRQHAEQAALRLPFPTTLIDHAHLFPSSRR